MASKDQNTREIKDSLTAHSTLGEATFTTTFKDLHINTSIITKTYTIQNASSSLVLVGNEARQGSTGQQQKLRENLTTFSPFIISASIFAVMALLVLFLLFKKKRSTRVRHVSESNQSNRLKLNYSASMHSTRKEKSFIESHPNTPIPSRTPVSARTQATPSTSFAPRTPLLNGIQATTISSVNMRTPVLTRTLATPSAPVCSQTQVLPRTPQSYQSIEYITTELCETSLRSWTPNPRPADSTSNGMTLLQPGIPFETCPEVQLQRPMSSRTPMPDLSIVLPRTPFKSWTPIPPKTPTDISFERQNWAHS
eukprot:Seg2057.3_Seg2057.4 transcript_id=Seg2057.3_Seg2057.4/GoldUCD/mRNA.D3Y31 product="hypothetical protein" protein_id=Seg2057.3_Seg2057.4/GoldUCD/D3Y31